MLTNHIGEVAALITAFFWTITAIAFEIAGKKVGSLSVNLIRLVIAFIFLTGYNFVVRGLPFPVDATATQWLWLSISGIVGFVLGDLFLFQAYVVIGARISMLIMALAPFVAAIIGWFVLGETMNIKQFIALLLTFSGICIVVLKRKENENGEKSRKLKFKYPVGGLLLALGGAIGQGGGLVLSKLGMGTYNPFAASQIRVLTGVIGFTLLFIILGKLKQTVTTIKNRKAMLVITLGAFFGPFLGVSFSLLSVQYTTTGIASTIMSIVPILIIPPSIIIFREKFKLLELIGAIISLVGVSFFFL
jgi:Predicted membrane protein